MALGLDLGFLKTVDLGILVVLVLVDQCCLSLNLGLGLAWVLLPDAVVLGQVFLRCLGVLGFRFFLNVGDFVDSAMGSRLRYLIRIIRSLHLGLGLEVGLVLVAGLPSLLEQAGLGLDEDPNGAAGAFVKRSCCPLEAKWLQSVVSRSRQESALGL